MTDYIIIGGGIVGLSVAKALLDQYPKARVKVLEKESAVACHQTGNNSGVIHSGIYYPPGSYKANFAKAGNERMKQFCKEHNIDVDICGKIIVATEESELDHLEKLYLRGIENGLDVELLDEKQLKEQEPYVNGIKGIYVPSAGIVDFKQVSQKLADLITLQKGHVYTNEEVIDIEEGDSSVIVKTKNSTFKAKYLINCAGLQSDRIAKMAGYHIDMKIFPFRGEYFYIKDEKKHLVNNLIYPVPDPNFPFLGVHFTRKIDGKVDVGPNAVPGFKREAYSKVSFNLKDFAEIISFKGFWKLGLKYYKVGIQEIMRSFNKKLFVKNAQKLIPSIKEEDLIPAPAGVRAQALKIDGTLVDDFYIVKGKNSIHVCNAPSPAATAALEIGSEIVKKIEESQKINN